MKYWYIACLVALLSIGWWLFAIIAKDTKVILALREQCKIDGGTPATLDGGSIVCVKEALWTETR